MNLAASSAERRSMPSVRDRGHLPDELVARQLTDHEIGDIRPGDAIAASRDPFGDDPISTGPRSVGEDHRPHHDPTKIPGPEAFEHRALHAIHAGQEHPSDSEGGADGEGSHSLAQRARARDDDDPSHHAPY